MSSPFDKSEIMSKAPAWLDLAQSLTGLALAVFTWCHLLFDSSIILGKDALYWVSGMLEAKFLSDGEHGYPIIVVLIGVFIFVFFVIHAGVALRKFPISWKQHKIIRNQMKILNHRDTNLWYWQFFTGFFLFFFVSVHVYLMIANADNIGPFASSDRFVSGNMWPLYLLLLIAVVVHAGIGTYRLIVKWGVLDGKNPRGNRKRAKAFAYALIVFYLAINFVAFALYVKTGIEHRDNVGERYKPSHSSTTSAGGEH